MAADDQQFCLRWNNFQTNFTSQFKALRIDEDFVDVTIACDGKRVKAHKLVLSACSPYFKELFKANPCKHPIIFLHDVEYDHLMGLVEFMYVGQVNVCQARLPDFLHTAEALQIRGLSPQSQNKLPQTEDNDEDLRPGPSLKESPRGSADSPEPSTSDDGRGEEPFVPPNPSKRFCAPADTRESTSYSDVPTTQLIETKMEPMDYYSDNEMQPHVPHNSSSDHHPGNRSGFSFHGALEAASSMAAQISQIQEPIQESADLVGEMCKPHSSDSDRGPVVAVTPAADPLKPHSLDPRPCPECGRIYSNISNLRQHIRLIHYPECITCPLCYKPFKNKLYLRRHVMSFHEINLPSQNDLRYKYANLMGGSGNKSEEEARHKYASLMSGGKSDPAEAYDAKITPEIAALFGPSKPDPPIHKYASTDKTAPAYYSQRTRATVTNVPSKT